MNRERLLEDVALLWADCETWDTNMPNNGRYLRAAATAKARQVLDLLLPQVSTVEELEALLVSMSEAGSPTLVIDPRGTAWTLFEDDRGGWWGQRLACEGETQEDATVPVSPPYGTWPQDQDLPLTVVWQPEVDHG